MFLVLLNNCAGQACTGIACGLCAVIIGVGVHYQCTTGDVVGAAAHADLGSFILDDGQSIGIGAQAGQISSVLWRCPMLAVGRIAGVKVAASAAAICAGTITGFMDVEAMYRIGLEAADLSRHLHHAMRVLHKMHFAGDGTALDRLKFCRGRRILVDARTSGECSGSQAQEQNTVSHSFPLMVLWFRIGQLFHINTFITVRRV